MSKTGKDSEKKIERKNMPDLQSITVANEVM